jgi:hypothetical protein
MAITVSVAWIGIGWLTFMMAGQAQGFVVAGVHGLFLLIGLLFHVIAVPFVAIRVYLFIRRRVSLPNSTWLILAALLVGDGLIFLGERIDQHKVAETMSRGDELISIVEQYKKKRERLPSTLDEATSLGVTIPAPALRGSAFRYSKTPDGDFTITFDSVAFLTCEKRGTDKKWRCDD